MESWATELIRAIDEIELKLKEAEKHSNKNEQVNQTYNEAIGHVFSCKDLLPTSKRRSN
jgi:hypothetical protein